MVYIPWAQYGICKYWMLKRCYGGENCQWKHPSPHERQRLWDQKTAEQESDFNRGIARPINPRYGPQGDTQAGEGDGVSGSVERCDGPVSAMIPPLPPPPVLPPPGLPPPPPLLTVQRPSKPAFAASGANATQLPTAFAARGSGAPAFEELSLSGRDISMLDAPQSPVPESTPGPLPGSFDGQFDGAMGQSFGSGSGSTEGNRKVRAREKSHSGGRASFTSDVRVARGSDVATTDQSRVSSIDALDHKSCLLSETSLDHRGEGGSKQHLRARTVGEARLGLGTYFPDSIPSPAPEYTANSPGTSSEMGATKRMANGEVKHVGPHPSTIHVSARYASQASIEKKLQPSPAASAQAAPDVQERLTAEAREDSIRLQGCRWLDDVRRQMQLPIRTFTTACTYYHKFRLAHPQHVAGMEYGNAWADACAASLLTACKVEDTLKKSKDVLAAAHNLRAATTGGEQVGTDDAMFEAPSRVVIGLERLVLEAGSFDFRSKYPHELMVKIAKTLEGDEQEKRTITGLAWTVLTDLHRTFAPLKQTSASLAVASLELASHLYAAGTPNDSSAVRDGFADFNFEMHSTSREEVMETILDALDLYTHHTLSTLLGSRYSLDDYLRIRLAFNKECTENTLPRFTLASPRDNEQEPSTNTLRVHNGHPTPVSPPQPETQTQAQPQQSAPPASESGTLRFVLNPQLAADEKSEVQKYFVEEWEEYEEEIEVPLPRAPSPDRGSDRSVDRRPPPPGGPPPRALPPGPPRGEYRGGGGRYDDRRPPRYDDRRYDDRRYDDRRGGGRYDDRRYDDRRRDRR